MSAINGGTFTVSSTQNACSRSFRDSRNNKRQFAVAKHRMQLVFDETLGENIRCSVTKFNAFTWDTFERKKFENAREAIAPAGAVITGYVPLPLIKSKQNERMRRRVSGVTNVATHNNMHALAHTYAFAVHLKSFSQRIAYENEIIIIASSRCKFRCTEE